MGKIHVGNKPRIYRNQAGNAWNVLLANGDIHCSIHKWEDALHCALHDRKQ